MKAFILFIATLFAGLTVSAQTATSAFSVSGIKVIFKPTIKNVINVRVYYRGGVTNYPADKAGIEGLALAASTQCGTKKYAANAFRDTADKYGVALAGGSAYDYGFIQVNCISKYFNKGWDLFSEAVTEPVFETNELALLKNKALIAIKKNLSVPEIRLGDLQMRNAFANTPYATDPSGTEQTLTALTADDLKNYYKTLLNKDKMFIVVVGNITKDELYEKILFSFGNLPSRPYTAPDLAAPVFTGNKLLTEQLDIKTNYVSAVMNAPEYTSPDYVPFRMAINGLGGNLYQYLRTMENLSYNPSVGVFSRKMPFAVMSASSGNPQRVIQGMVNVLKYVQNKGYNDEWLQHIKNSYITSSFVNDQSAAQITSNLGLAEILGNWHYADDLPQLVNMVTVEQVNKVINFYITGLRWSYVGDTNAIEGFNIPAY